MLTGRRRAQWETIVWTTPHLKKGVRPSDANPYRPRNRKSNAGAQLDAWIREEEAKAKK